MLIPLVFLARSVKCDPGQLRSGSSARIRDAWYRGDSCLPGVLNCYPDARGIPFADTEHITPLSNQLWAPKDVSADFRRNSASVGFKGPEEGYHCRAKDRTMRDKKRRGFALSQPPCWIDNPHRSWVSSPHMGSSLNLGMAMSPRASCLSRSARTPGRTTPCANMDSYKVQERHSSS